MLILLLILFQINTYSTFAAVLTITDTQAPTAPKDLKMNDVTFTSTELVWEPAIDNIGIKGYEVYCNGKKVASTSKTVYEYKKLSPGGAYLFYIKAYDKAGNYSTQSNTISINTWIDKTAPSMPSGLKATSISETEVTLIWAHSSDNVKVRGYELFRNGVKIGSTSKNTYSSKKLFPNKSYTYTVKASDMSGNLSDFSRPLLVTTSKDSQAPKAPAELKITAIKGASVSLEWIASIDNSKIGGYQVYCNGIVISTAAGTKRTVKSPFNLDSDTYFIKSYDIAGNLSAASNTVTVTVSD